ncbi:MAG: hypothetical protein HN336_01540 [Lentimicrobiaceae bacterium]|jgi:hypothetical protein|nr:hypothetical protein [Lentimicrobiaceae bacterium]MCP4910238.1 hypothetical protein [Bacteroidota bacterium]MBT3455347.1 hypothetical protein [Lentimicrobiaceae bacterium]MBT3818813.1 hypothetical protein [Lentimicrobiaceae bacterium]MBT4062080.1 hypothetical protein [Lentimicrobiaceae bacterium]
MKTILILIAIVTQTISTNYVIDFGKSKQGNKWLVVNDGVMGGLSNSTANISNNYMNFEGTISLQNNGGFASVRSFKSNINLSDFTIMKVRYRSRGQKVSVRLLKNDAYYLPYFKTALETTSWVWKTTLIPLKNFKEYQLNRQTEKNLNSSDFNDIIRIGLIVSNKKQGNFEIDIDYIEFY